MDTSTLTNVSQQQFDRLRAYLVHNGCSGVEGNSGTAVAECLTLGYRFDPTTGTLELQAERLPKNLQTLPDNLRVPAALRLMSNVMGHGAAPRAMALAAASSYPNHPSTYGVYDYVIPFITNNTGHIFSFKDQTMAQGTLASYTSTVAANNTQVQLFEADSSKLSGTGVGGTVNYVWQDNTTIMTINFFLNTEFTHSFSVGFSTTSLTATVTSTDPTLAGYTYLDPQITVQVAS